MIFFSIEEIFFTLLGYPLSYLEFFGTLTGVVAVALSARAKIWSWPVGIVNVVLSFFLFYQVQLYPDMALQIFFLITNVVGWWRWAHPRPGQEDRNRELKVSHMTSSEILWLASVGTAGTLAVGWAAQHVHTWFPIFFTNPSAAPFVDSFITVMSIVTTFYMIRKKIESWIVWIAVDAVATWLYFIRDIKFYSLLYFIFCGLAAYGWYNWHREYRSYGNTSWTP